MGTWSSENKGEGYGNLEFGEYIKEKDRNLVIVIRI